MVTLTLENPVKDKTDENILQCKRPQDEMQNPATGEFGERQSADLLALMEVLDEEMWGLARSGIGQLDGHLLWIRPVW